MAKKRLNFYDLFNPPADGKGVKKEAALKPDLLNFFKLYGRNFSRLITVNIFLIFGNFPIFFGLLGLSGNVSAHSTTPISYLFGPLHGAMLSSQASPVSMAIFGVHGIQANMSVNTVYTYIAYALCGLMIFTFGLTNVGTTYILRNIVKGEPIFIWDDFWYAIRRNLRQGMTMGIIDLLLIALLAYDIMFFYSNIGPFVNNMMFYFSLFMALLYFLMRFYIYILMITFDLSIFKIYKNALIFSILGFGRNIAAFFGILFLLFVNYALILTFVPLGALFPFIFLFSNGAFMTAYAAFPKIKEHMIDPYYTEEKSTVEPIFHDMG